MSIDWTKPVQTIGGVPVRILCTDGPGQFPVIGIVGSSHCVDWWTIDGVLIDNSRSRFNLINVPPPKKKVKVEVRLWKDHDDIVRSASNVMHTGREWPSDEPTPWLASSTIEMEYEEQ